MKHKLKGLVCLWLAVLLLALPALAADRGVWIYTDTDNSIDPDFWLMVEAGQVQNVTIDDSLPMNQQNLQYPEKSGYQISGWNIWSVECGGLVPWTTVSPSAALSGSLNDPYSEGYVLEPTWSKYRISQQPTALVPTVGTQEGSVDDGWVDCTADAYRWYEVEDKVYTVVPNKQASDQIAITSAWCSYDFNYGTLYWAPKGELDIYIPVSAGDVIRVTREFGEFTGTVKGNFGETFAQNGDVYTQTVSRSDDYYNLCIDSSNGCKFTIEIERPEAVLIPGQTGATLTAMSGGKSYYCEAVFLSGGDSEEVLRSNTFFVPPATCTVSFESNGGSAVTSQTVAYDTCATVPTAPTRIGYDFDGWYSDTALTTAYDFSAAVTENITLYAKWRPATRTVTFETNGGSEVKAQTVDYGTAVTAPTAPEKEGYVFDGWYTDSALTNAYDFSAVVTKNITLYAKWHPESRTVTFETNGGSEVKAQTVDYGTAVTAPADPEKEGHIFDGWYSDSALTAAYDFSTAVTKNITLYAKWHLDTRTVTFESNGGSEIEAQTVDYGSCAALPAEPVRSGYIFIGWYTDEALTILYDFSTPVKENITLYAKWWYYSSNGISGAGAPVSHLNSKLHFETNGGSPIADYTAPRGTTVRLEQFFTVREGYDFTGWYTDSGLTQKIGAVTLTNSTTVYAGWSALQPDVVPQPVPTLPFADVTRGMWSYEDIAYVYGKGLMNGIGSGLFAPGLTTDRAMVVTILYRLEGEPAVGACSFTDVPAGEWYTNAFAWAEANGIVSGYGNGKCGPMDLITREQLAAILYRYAVLSGVDVSVGENTNILSYNDALTVSEYAIPAMQWACGSGLIAGSNGDLMPGAGATREQLAAVLHRFCENIVG